MSPIALPAAAGFVGAAALRLAAAIARSRKQRDERRSVLSKVRPEETSSR